MRDIVALIEDIECRDTKENSFNKTVQLIWREDGRLVLDMGGPIIYNCADLLKHYPSEKPLVIDMGGLNHKGFPVRLSMMHFNRLMGIAKRLLEERNGTEESEGTETQDPQG